jgi:hypothetical protein
MENLGFQMKVEPQKADGEKVERRKNVWQSGIH